MDMDKYKKRVKNWAKYLIFGIGFSGLLYSCPWWTSECMWDRLGPCPKLLIFYLPIASHRLLVALAWAGRASYFPGIRIFLGQRSHPHCSLPTRIILRARANPWDGCF